MIRHRFGRRIKYAHGRMKIGTLRPIGLLSLLLSSLLCASIQARENKKVPGDMALVKALRQSWKGLSCTGELNIAVGDRDAEVLVAPMAIANKGKALKWVAIVTPPSPCAGTMVLGTVEIGLGKHPSLEIGTPPGMIIGEGPALLSWRTISRGGGSSPGGNTGTICGGAQSDRRTAEMFSSFAGGLGHRPEKREWDREHPTLLHLEGRLKDGLAKDEAGRYHVWLDSERGYLPVRSLRKPAQGATVQTVYEPKEVLPGRWLPMKWETSGAGQATVFGTFKNLRCDRPIPDSWFDSKSWKEVESQNEAITFIRAAD